MSVVVGLPAAFILIAVCAALATGSSRSRWFLCGSDKSKIMKNSTGGAKRQAGTGQRRITGGKFLDNSASARNLNGGRGGGRSGDMINSSNVQQQQQLSCDLQIRYNMYLRLKFDKGRIMISSYNLIKFVLDHI